MGKDRVKKQSLPHGAFEKCFGLTELTVPTSVTSIGDRAFYGCRGLTELTILGNIDSIGDEAFGGCSLGTVFVTRNNREQIERYFDQNGVVIKLECIKEADEESLHTNNPTEALNSCEPHIADWSTHVETPLVANNVVESAELLGDNDNDA